MTDTTILEETLDRYFPKGDKRRGDALVLYAVAMLIVEEVIKGAYKK